METKKNRRETNSRTAPIEVDRARILTTLNKSFNSDCTNRRKCTRKLHFWDFLHNHQREMREYMRSLSDNGTGLVDGLGEKISHYLCNTYDRVICIFTCPLLSLIHCTRS